MNLEDKTNELSEIYAEFEQSAAEFKKFAACGIGCADCCTHVGNVDITTLEGLVIQKRLSTFNKKEKRELKKRIARNRTDRERGSLAKCAFLKKDNSCLIYDIRPFSCRRIYSIKSCNGNHPVVHRQAIAVAKQTIQKLQHLDNTGYSGHMSFILYLLEKPSFKKAYMAGQFDPGKIMTFGKSHGIIINRFAG
jgi:Fe-S-cluster containining protein